MRHRRLAKLVLAAIAAGVIAAPAPAHPPAPVDERGHRIRGKLHTWMHQAKVPLVRGRVPPAEWFADGYAGCAVRVRLRRRLGRTAYGYAPTRHQHARVCRLIRRAAKPHGRRPQRPKNPPPVVEVAPPPPEESQPGPESCTLVDQLLMGCKPPPPPAVRAPTV